MSREEAQDAFTAQEFSDIQAAAAERGLTVYEILHDAVMADLAR